MIAMNNKVFRLEPTVDLDDPNWDGANYFGTVYVCAHSAADARIVAKDAETSLMKKTGVGTPAGLESVFSSAFVDEKLYHVSEDRSGRFSCDEGRKVLFGMSIDDIVFGLGAKPG
jgi:hypothetical protein